MLSRVARTTPASIVRWALVLLAAVAAVLLLPAGADAATFEDTRGTSAQAAVDQLAERGVIRGCGEDDFCPSAPLTRAQMASLLVAALELPAFDVAAAGGASAFDDIDGSVHESNIGSLAAAGIVRGCSDGSFCPSEVVTRGQMATMIAAAFALPEAQRNHFDDTTGVHGQAINRLAEAGIAAGCGDPLTDFCVHAPVQRGQSAMFLARAMELVPPVALDPLEVRRALQAERDAAAAAAKAAAEAAAKAAAEAKAKAEAEAAKASVDAARDAIWTALARCESGGNWSINTGNGYYGGLQFSLASWRWVGGSGYPHQASRAEQIRRGEILQSRQGWGAWPACSRKLGLR